MTGVADAAPRGDFAVPLRHDIAAEQAVLGGMMLAADALADCLELLTVRAFLRPAHQAIFEAIWALSDQVTPVDALTVKAELERRGELSRVGGAPYLHTLLAAVPAAANAGYYARQLVDLQAQRDLDIAGTQIRQLATEPGPSRQERIDRAYAALDDAAGYAVKSGAVPVSDLILPLIASLEEGPSAEPGISTGWVDVDAATSGLRPGQVVVVAARPAMGKSIVLGNLAAHAALRQKLTVLAVTLEMSRNEYMERLLAAEARVTLGAIRRRELAPRDWDRISKAHAELAACPNLVVHEGPGLSVQDMRSELRAMRRAGTPADLVCVDYLQLVTGSARIRENRQAEVSDISRALKLLAKESGVPVVVGAQLNRGPEMRTDKRPQLADIRESGALENDSDIVILLYRDDYYYDESARAGEIDFILAKNRSGPKTTVSLAFQGHYARCMDMAAETWVPESYREAS